MTIRTILAATSGGTASSGAVELGCQLARHFDAHLECFHARLDPEALIAAASFGDAGLVLDVAWVDKMEAEAQATAAKAKKAAMAILSQRGIGLAADASGPGLSAAWQEARGYAPYLVPRHARFFDLTVLGRSDRVVGQPHSDVIEETLVLSGRPVLLAPAKLSGTVGNTVALGWNGSVPAVRALQASLPFLGSARTILLITIGEKHEESVHALKKYFGWRGIGGDVRHLAHKSTANPGDALLSAARDEGADLLVMGGYGHTPWRELIFGGATREVVGTAGLPVLLSH
jgi:nucleotide-binding universal stress UspA family protein